MKSIICRLATETALLLCAVACFGQSPTNPYAGPQHAGPQPRVYLESASIGTNTNAFRNQSMEMAKDFLKICPAVKTANNPALADYTLRLNHIEKGLIYRDNQVEVYDKNGDLMHNKEGGSWERNVHEACDLIQSDWTAQGNGSITLQPGPNPSTSSTSKPEEAWNFAAQQPPAERKTVSSQPSQPSPPCERGSEAATLGVMVCSADGGLRVTSGTIRLPGGTRLNSFGGHRHKHRWQASAQ